MDQLDESPVLFVRDEHTEKLRQDVVGSSRDTRRAFLVLGVFSLYLIITVGSTTHLQLLTGTVFTLPFLLIDIPILGFYVTMPLLYMLAHFNLLGELNALSDDVRRLKDYLREHDIRLLKPIPFGPARTLIQPDDSSLPPTMVNGVTSLTIAVLPPLILLLVQIRFLPYHAEWVIWWHRIIILLDILLVFFLWFPLKSRCLELLRQDETEHQSLRQRWTVRGKTLLRSLCSAYRHGIGPWLWTFIFVPILLLTSIALATVPDGWMEGRLQDLGLGMKDIGVVPSSATEDVTYHGVTPAKRKMLTLTYYLFEAPNSLHWMRRNLVVSHTDLVPTRPSDEVLFLLEDDGLKEDEDRKKDVWDQGSRGLDLRGRNLRYAIFSFSDMHKADLRGADLEGAVFFKTKLRYADFGDIARAEVGRCAEEPFLWGQFDEFVKMKKIRGNRANWCLTNLRYAFLRSGEMQHARLWEADLTNADITSAELQHADLNHANLQHADLMGARLQKAELNNVDLRHANLTKAKLNNAKLNNWTRVSQANFAGAELATLEECRIIWSGVLMEEIGQNGGIKEEKITRILCHSRFLQ